MGCCLPNNRSDNLIVSSIPKNDLSTTYKIFNDKNENNYSPNQRNENKNEVNNIVLNNNNEENTNNLKLDKNKQPITTNINNINININQISKNSEVKQSDNDSDQLNDIKNEKIVKPTLNTLDKQSLKDIFTNHFLFKNKSHKLISSIIESLEIMLLPKNHILFKKGDKGDFFCIIKEGKIELNTKDDNDDKDGIKILNVNDTFGELALMHNKKRTASAKAVENCKLLILNGKKFREIISEKTENELKDRMNILGASPIFSSLDNNKLNALATGLISCSFESNQKILIGQSIYIIRYGKVKCLNGEQEIRFLGPKDYFGECAILFDVNRSLTVIVEETTECYQLSETLLKEILGEDFKQEIINSISKNAFNNSPIMKIFTNTIYFQKIIENYTIESYKDYEIIIKKDENESKKKKLYVILSGNLIEKETNNIVASRGELYGDSIIKYNKVPKYNIVGINGIIKIAEFDWDLIIEKFGLGLNSKKVFSLFAKVENLRNISLFKETPKNKLIDIVKVMKKKMFKKDQIIFREGEVGDILYMIKKGTVHILKDEKKIREYGQGVCFGEIALLVNGPRTATAISMCDSTIYYLTKNDFKAVLDENMVFYLEKKMALEDGFNTSLENLYFSKSLGHGKFGDVSLVHNDKSFFAIKAVNRKAAEKQKILIKYYIQERAILLGLQHPFIMKLVKTFKTESNIFFLLEYISGRTMGNYLNSRTKKQLNNFQETIFYISILFVALNYLNSKNICHRDLKPDNIIIDERGYLKIIDFGNSVQLNGFTNTMTGTPHYMAPEILLRGGYGFSCDYWSVGIIAYETYYGKYPFGDSAKDPIEVYKEVIKKKLEFKTGDQKIIKMIKSLLTKKVAERICSLEKAKDLEAFENFNWDELLDFKIIPQYIPKKSNIKQFKDYRTKYINYLKHKEEAESNEDNKLLSSYEDDEDIPYDENWADVF